MENASSNVVVAVRIRPLSSAEIGAGQKSCCQAMGNVVAIKKDGDAGQYLKSQQLSISEYAYDIVFDENSTQKDVYDGTAKKFIPKVLNGENVTIFAYGATGAGKTHTMLGNTRTDEAAQRADAGIIPNSVSDLFAYIDSLSHNLAYGESYQVLFSYMEVYNEQVYDLLDTTGTGRVLSVREDQERNIVVAAGLIESPVQDYQSVVDLILQGNRQRKTEATMANAVSSRSHAILQLSVRHTTRLSTGRETHVDSKLSLIDLAGSERASATNNRGVRLQEGANINKSLLALANCINSLSEKAHSSGNNAAGRKSMVINVKYRDSKLTHLLKCSLEGNCNLVMIANLNPSHVTYEDSHNTLKYANRAKNIKVNPIVKEVAKESTWLEREQRLREENQSLKSKIAELEGEVQLLRQFQAAVQLSGLPLPMEIRNLLSTTSNCNHNFCLDDNLVNTEIVKNIHTTKEETNENLACNGGAEIAQMTSVKVTKSVSVSRIRPAARRESMRSIAYEASVPDSEALPPPVFCADPDYADRNNNSSSQLDSSVAIGRKRRASHLPVAALSKRRCSMTSVVSSVTSALSSLATMPCLSAVVEPISVERKDKVFDSVTSEQDTVTYQSNENVEEEVVTERGVDEDPAPFAEPYDYYNGFDYTKEEQETTELPLYINHLREMFVDTVLDNGTEKDENIIESDMQKMNSTLELPALQSEGVKEHECSAGDREKMQELEMLGIFELPATNDSATNDNDTNVLDGSESVVREVTSAVAEEEEPGMASQQQQRRSMAYNHRKRSIARVNAMLDTLTRDVSQLIANKQHHQDPEFSFVQSGNTLTDLQHQPSTVSKPTTISARTRLAVPNPNVNDDKENELTESSFTKVSARRVTRSMVSRQSLVENDSCESLEKVVSSESDNSRTGMQGKFNMGDTAPVTRRRASLLSEKVSESVSTKKGASVSQIVKGVTTRRRLTLMNQDNLALQQQPVSNPFADI